MMIASLSTDVARLVSGHFIGALLPHQCLNCRGFTQTAGLCPKCWDALEPLADPLCARCGRHLVHALPDMICGACWMTPPPLDRIRAACLYSDASRALILKFKHGDALHLVPVLAGLMQRSLDDVLIPGQIVVPIPLHRWRFFNRRYNQSAELARAICRVNSKIQFAPGSLVRIKSTQSLGRLSRHQRRQMLAGAFAVPDSARQKLSGRPVLLVDDVITTGATLFEAARTLERAGCGAVRAITIARVQ